MISDLAQIFTTYYNEVTFIAASLLSSLFVQTDETVGEKSSSKAIENARYLIIYLIAIAASLSFYAFSRCEGSFFIFLSIVRTNLKSFGLRQLIEIIVLPFIVAVIVRGIRERNPAIRKFLIAALAILLFAAPFLTAYRTDDNGLDVLLLYRFKEIDYPYTTKIYDPDGFYYTLSNGYGDFPADNNNDEDERTLGNIDENDFTSLVEAAAYFVGIDDNKATYYLNKAYAIYNETDEASLEPHSVGSMWFYKGRLEERADFYANAGKKYKSIGEYYEFWNAALSFEYAYGIEQNDLYAEEALDSTYVYCQRFGADDYIQDRVENTLLLMQRYYVKEVPHLEYFTINLWIACLYRW